MEELILNDKRKNINALLVWSKVVDIVGCVIAGILFMGALFSKEATSTITFTIFCGYLIIFSNVIALLIKNRAYMLDTLISMQNMQKEKLD